MLSLYNDQDTNEVNKFILSLKNQFKKLGAKKIVAKMHYKYISGFFTVNEQAYYFSTSNFDNYSRLLIRTAKDYQDFTGGSNNFVDIKNGMYKKIAQIFNLTIDKYTQAKQTVENAVADILDTGNFNKRVTSGKFAVRVMFKLQSRLETNARVIETKIGKNIVKIVSSNNIIDCYYNGTTKYLSVSINK